MSTWMLKRITDYWDQQVGAVYTHARRLEALDQPQRQQALAEIASAVIRHVAALDNEWLGKAAFIMADDLYKAACALNYWDNSISEYLHASSNSFLNCIAERGFVLRFVIDNAYEASEVGMRGPVEWFPIWFNAAGFSYICPQQFALLAMKGSGRAASPTLLPEFISEGRKAGFDLLHSCANLRRHYVYLDADATNESIERAADDAESPGVILVLRTEAPVPGSRVVVKIAPP